MQKRARGITTWIVSVGLLAAFATAASAQPPEQPTPEDPAFAGAADIGLGDDVRAEFSGLPGEIHQYSFFATAGSRLGATLVTDKDASLLADVRLTWSGGKVLASAQRVSASNVHKTRFPEYTFRTSGIFVLEVVRRSGSGGYALTTHARREKRIRGLDPAPGESGTFRFDAPGDAVLRIKVRVPRSHQRGAGPLITGLLGPLGESIAIEPRTRGQKALAKGIVLTDAGTYTLQWSNPGRADRLRFAFDVKASSSRANLDLGAPGAISPTAPDVWDAAASGRAGYVGSTTCGRCHDQIYRSWSRTSHHLGSREWMRGGLTGVSLVNDANGNGANDFMDGFDLGGLDTFAAFGADAPVLSWVAGDERPARATIGGVTYVVERTMGGNGRHQQSYVARIGLSLYPLPFEYDERQHTYLPFEADYWYGEGGARYGSEAAVDDDVSYEARCAGCHATGLFVATDTAGKIVAGYSEADVGCEQCHGPGAEHAVMGDPALIRNPEDVLDNTPAGVQAANSTCTRCHDRGEGADPIPGSGVVPGYPYNAASGVAQAGDDLGAFFVPTSDPSDFWGFKLDPVPAIPGPRFITSRRRYMQGRDLAAGHHAATDGFAPTCFECHSPHARTQEHMLAAGIDRGGRVDTRLPDNSFCLACHAGRDDYAAVTLTDVQSLSDGFVAPSIVTATTQHMSSAGMTVPESAYDPTGTGVGRCSKCHMPDTAGDGVGRTDAAGYRIGDTGSHEFRIIWPRASVLNGMTNSCNGCHPTRANDLAQKVIEQWQNPVEEGGTTFHADTPRSFQNGLANANNAAGGVPCVQCHTTEGFIRIQVEGEVTGQDDWNEMLASAIGHAEGITCRVCHGKAPDGSLGNGDPPLRFPPRELCGRCHNDETVKFADFRDDGERVRHPQREMLDGTAGEEIPNSGSYRSTPHSSFASGCITCHFTTLGAGERTHGFHPRPETCGACHSDVTFDRPSTGDWDGNGVIAGVQTEVHGLLDVLEAGLLADPLMSLANGTFNYGESSDGSLSGASESQKRAVFNYYTVTADGSFGVHNAVRIVQLLQRSYDDVVGAPVPGADLR